MKAFGKYVNSVGVLFPILLLRQKIEYFVNSKERNKEKDRNKENKEGNERETKKKGEKNERNKARTRKKERKSVCKRGNSFSKNCLNAKYHTNQRGAVL